MLRAGALFIAVAISFVIAVLVSLLITLAFHYKIQNKENLLQKKLERNCKSAFAILMVDNEQSEGTTVLDLYGEESDSVEIKKMNWGIYEVASVKAFSGRYATTKTKQYGYKPEDNLAVYLADLSRPLNLCGKTKITGTCYLPEAGVKRGYIEGKSFEGSTLINGQIQNSKNTLPVLDKKILQSLSEMIAAKFPTGQLFKEVEISSIDTLIQSFLDTTILIRIAKGGSLSGKYLSGNIIVYGADKLTIDKTSKLEDVLVFANSISFSKEFIGNLQAYATDSILVEEDCILNYPSVLGLFKKDHKTQQPFIKLMKGAVVKGMVFTTQSELVSDLAKTRVSIEKGARVEGQIYVDGFADIQGELWGTVWCQKFLLKTASSVYENHLLDAVIDRAKLSEHYVGSAIITSGKKKKTIKWLE